jgi:hypothetical protein
VFKLSGAQKTFSWLNNHRILLLPSHAKSPEKSIATFGIILKLFNQGFGEDRRKAC